MDATALETEVRAQAVPDADKGPNAACEPDEDGPTKGRGRARRYGVIALFSLVVPVVFLAAAVFALSGKPLVAPMWVRGQVERIVSTQFPEFDVRIGAMSLVLEEDWDPRLVVRDLEVIPATGAAPVRLGTLNARMAFAPLLDRQLAPRDVRLSGLSLKVVRQADGVINIAFGQDGDGGTQFDGDLSAIGAQVEAFLHLPALAHLQDFRIEDVTVRFEDRRAQQAWTVDGGQIGLKRGGETVELSTQLTLLSGRSYASSIEGSLITHFDSPEVEIGLNFEDIPSQDIASQAAALSWLEILRAPISGAMRAGVDAEGKLANINVALSVDEGVLQPDNAVRAVPFEALRSYLTYDPKAGTLRFDELSLTSDWVRASAFGQVFVGDMRQGLPKEFLAQLTLTEFRANLADVESRPIALERSFADFRMRLDPFRLDVGQLVVRQSGNDLVLSGRLDTSQGQWDYSLDGHMERFEADPVMAMWPVDVKAKLRKWLDNNIYQAVLQDINLAVRSNGTNMPDIYADFQFEDAVVKAMKTMPPVRGGVGFGVWKDHQLHIALEEGHVIADQGGQIDVSGSSMVIENTRIKQSPGHVRAKASGPIEAVMSLLDRKPLSIFTKAKLPVDFAPGHAELAGDVWLVLRDKLPIEEVRYDVSGVLSGVRSQHFIKNKEMRGDLTVHATDERVDIVGAGFLEELPVTAHWHMLMGKENAGRSWLTGEAELSALALETFEVGLPKGTVSGTGIAKYSLDIAQGTVPDLRVTSDLAGVGLAAPPLGWRIGPKTTGDFALRMSLGAAPKIDEITLEAPGFSARGNVSIAETGGLGVAQLDQFSVGDWVHGSARVRGRGANVAPAIEITSGVLDMRKMPDTGSGKGGVGQGSGPISAQLDAVIVTDSIRLAPARADLTTSGGLKGTFEGRFDGGPAVAGSLFVQPHGTGVKVTSPEGGRIATQMGLVKAATRGPMTLTMVPRAAASEYDGVLQMTNVKVQKIPLVAELLNAISVIGLIEQLDGPGILFTEVFSRFRLTPERLIIGEASAVGPSMGLSANGTYSLAQSWFDFQGAVSPIYAVNVIGRPISRRGEGLIGFNYTLRGPSQDPVVSVNPLSALTPGFFREIFRRPPPDLSN